MNYCMPTEPVAAEDWEAGIPVRPMREMRGFLQGMDTVIEPEEDRLA
jgi:hypothetical protein